MEMFWQFDVYGTSGSLKMVTNPWLPDRDNNKIIINCNNEKTPVEINVTAEKSLYTYQIDAMGNKIRNDIPAHHGEVSWQDSWGNITGLDTWLQQIKANILF